MHSEPATSHSPPATHSDNEVLVRVEGVSKKFCRSLKKSLWYGLCDIGAELNPMSRKAEKLKLGTSENGSLSASQNFSISEFSPAAAARDEDLRDGEFYAVRDVSFELRRGECLGLIGHNGAGKTTLLKMLNGLIKPDAGRITMRGRVGALIALGAGFNPILTGRENIYINGSVLGLSKKEIDGKIDEIIDFAEIGEFIDIAGAELFVGHDRFGWDFAVATALKPGRACCWMRCLAVGDMPFRRSATTGSASYGAKARRLSLFRTACTNIARFTDQVLHLSHGREVFFGNANDGVASFYAEQSALSTALDRPVGASSEAGSLAMEITDAYFANFDGERVTAVRANETVSFVVEYKYAQPIECEPVIDMTLRLPTGDLFFQASSATTCCRRRNI